MGTVRMTTSIANMNRLLICVVFAASVYQVLGMPADSNKLSAQCGMLRELRSTLLSLPFPYPSLQKRVPKIKRCGDALEQLKDALCSCKYSKFDDFLDEEANGFHKREVDERSLHEKCCHTECYYEDVYNAC